MGIPMPSIPAILQALMYQGQGQPQGLPNQTASFPWPTSTIDQAPNLVDSQASLPPSPAIAQAGSAVGMTGQTPQYPTDIPVRHAQDILTQVLGQHQAPGQPPQPVNPAYRTEDLLRVLIGGGLSAAFGKNQGLEGFLGGYAGGKQHAADQKAQAQNYAYQQQEQERQGQEQRNVAIAQQGLSNAGANYSRDYQAALNQENQQSKDEQRAQQQYTQLTNAFRQAKSKKEMEQLAPLIQQVGQRLGLPIQPITPADVQQAWQERSGQRINEIEDNWRQIVTKATDQQYGTINDPDTIKWLESERDRMQKEIGMYNPDLQLSPVPTEKSLKAHRAEEMLQIAKDKYGLQKDLQVEKIAAMKANIERQKERIAIARQRADAGDFAMNTSRMNAELGRARFEYVQTIKGKLGTADGKKMTGLRAQAAGLQAKVDGYSKSGQLKAAATAKASLDAVNAQIKFYEDQLKDESQETEVGGASVAKGSSYGSSIMKTKGGNAYSYVRD